MINDYFDKIFCINLDDRLDRWTLATQEFTKHNLNVERMSAVDTRQMPPNNPEEIAGGAKGCSLSHAKILQRIIDEKIERTLILEDDVIFMEDVQFFFHHRERFIPANWNMLYLGGNHQKKLEAFNGPIYKTFGTYTTSSYGITLEFARYAIKHILSLESPVDVTYAKMMSTNKVYTFNPGIAWQRPGFSDIENEYKDYNYYLKNKI